MRYSNLGIGVRVVTVGLFVLVLLINQEGPRDFKLAIFYPPVK